MCECVCVCGGGGGGGGGGILTLIQVLNLQVGMGACLGPEQAYKKLTDYSV